jgi:hypothetical protein
MTERDTLLTLADMLVDCRDAIDRAVARLCDHIEAPAVGHIDDAPTRPTYHHRYASELVGNEIVERTPGEWDRVLEVRPTHDPFANGVDLVFADGCVTVVNDSSVRVRHDSTHPAAVRQELAETRSALHPKVDQYGNVHFPQDAA